MIVVIKNSLGYIWKQSLAQDQDDPDLELPKISRSLDYFSGRPVTTEAFGPSLAALAEAVEDADPGQEILSISQKEGSEAARRAATERFEQLEFSYNE
jgi:hypothetical protein